MTLSRLNKLLTQKLGKDWHKLEIETISLEIGALLDELSVVKMIVLKSLEDNPQTILNDAEFFLRFVEVANKGIPDPHHHDIPTSLELVFALSEIVEILGESVVKPNNMLSNVTRYVLNDEGHGEACHELLAKYSGKPLVTNEKSEAYTKYIAHMRGED